MGMPTLKFLSAPFIHVYIYVVVNFLSQAVFYFFCFLGMVMYANEDETKGKIKIT